ncbi:peptidase S8/S53 domain-containing protein [Aspergillus aurantiobrunneus]
MARREAAIDQFCILIDERTQGRVKVTPKVLSRSAVSEKPRSDAWLEAMERFRKELMGMHRSGLLTKPRRVRVGNFEQHGHCLDSLIHFADRGQVALIDDGIDLDEFNTYQTALYTGVSYCSGSGRDEDAWWKSTDGHGTIMANMISRINPWVVLDVIKIQSSPSYIHGEGARSISPKSAADAIKAAVMHGADIISMSWTITDLEYRMSMISDTIPDAEGNKTRADQSDLQLLRTAIKEAVKDDKRLLICSAADDVRLLGDNTLPYSEAPGQILRIGSAGPLANRDPGSGSGSSITYYLPGNQVAEEQRAHSAKPVVYHNGSSVSTALAAGLASLIIYCAHCLHSCGSGDDYQAWARALRNPTNMRKAFSSINRYLEWKDDKKIVPVWGIFGDKSSLLDKATSGPDKIKVLKDLVTYLCQDVK